jgi:uncharacterized protein (TIGR02246 family)
MKGMFLSALALLVATSAAAADHGAKTLDDAWVKAINANDLEAVVALYADDATMYPPDQMEAKGKEAIRANYAALLGANTVKDAKMLDARYETSGNFSMGWGHATLTVVPKAGGDPQTMEVRFTAIAVKRGGKWLYVNDHASAPLPPPPPAK